MKSLTLLAFILVGVVVLAVPATQFYQDGILSRPRMLFVAIGIALILFNGILWWINRSAHSQPRSKESRAPAASVDKPVHIVDRSQLSLEQRRQEPVERIALIEMEH